MRLVFCSVIYVFLGCTVSYGQFFTLPDTNFRNCLINRYKSVLNTSNQLVIAQATAFTGVLDCSNSSITNVDGLQYFTNVSEINLATNKLNGLPNILALTNLTRIDVSENNLSTLPDMTKYKRLKRLFAQRNYLKALPSLAQNDSLIELYVHTNSLDTLPDLSNLKQLIFLNVVHNKLKYLPNIEKLTELQSIICWENYITTIQSLANLDKLTILDASSNLLKTIPVFSPNAKLKKLILNKNQISIITTDFITDSLKVCNFSTNPLTFRELVKLTSKASNSTITVAPQNVQKVGSAKTIKEFDALKLYTGIDKGVADVTYTWYRNGILINTVSNDTLTIKNLTLADSGKYTCQIRHQAFPSLSLQTDTFRVSTYPCFVMPTISFTSTDITCTKSGTLTASAQNIPKDIAYLLKGLNSTKIQKSETGIFTGLQDPRYSLSLQTQTGCTKTYPKEITIAVQECKDFLVTPDNDGNMDSYFFSASGQVSIFDKSGTLVKKMSIPGEWDCMTASGKVPIGYYIAYINEGEAQIGLSVIY